MPCHEYEPRYFDPHTASEPKFAAVNRFDNRMRPEVWPDDPPLPLDATIRNLRSAPEYMEHLRWLLWRSDGTEIVARGSVEFWNTETNQHAAGSHIGVLPEARRQGLGRMLLRPIVEEARRRQKRLLFTTTVHSVPAGAAFMERIGARPGMEMRISQLDLADLDRDLMGRWLRPSNAAGYTLEWWAGAYPDEAVDEVAAMKNMQNLMPRENLDLEDDCYTPDRIRQGEAAFRLRKRERWTVVVREPSEGRIAGYTEVVWDPENPAVLHQDDTAVSTEHQNRGLGRWLKAAMIERVLGERPELRYVRTGNAESNVPMLKINVEMGFKPYRNLTEWQADVAAAEAYLNGIG